MDYLRIFDIDTAIEADNAGNTRTTAGMEVISLETAATEGWNPRAERRNARRYSHLHSISTVTTYCKFS